MSGVRCELEGGPFDGDSGIWPSREPRLWAFPCRDPANCNVKGSIHWTDDPIFAIQARAEPYDFDRVQDKDVRGKCWPVRIYVYAEITEGGGLERDVEELVGAGAGRMTPGEDFLDPRPPDWRPR